MVLERWSYLFICVWFLFFLHMVDNGSTNTNQGISNAFMTTLEISNLNDLWVDDK